MVSVGCSGGPKRMVGPSPLDTPEELDTAGAGCSLPVPCGLTSLIFLLPRDEVVQPGHQDPCRSRPSYPLSRLPLFDRRFDFPPQYSSNQSFFRLAIRALVRFQFEILCDLLRCGSLQTRGDLHCFSLPVVWVNWYLPAALNEVMACLLIRTQNDQAAAVS